MQFFSINLVIVELLRFCNTIHDVLKSFEKNLNFFSVTMSMANVGAQEAGMGGNVTYPAHRAPLGPTVATNATATTKPHAIRLMVVANANLVLLERAVKNTAPKATGVKIVIVLVNVQMPILYVTLFMGVFAGLDLQVRKRLY